MSELAPINTTLDVSEYLNIPVKTLEKWRHRGTGPTCIRMGKHIRYRREDVVSWLDSL